jgi:hypothetical protein
MCRKSLPDLSLWVRYTCCLNHLRQSYKTQHLIDNYNKIHGPNPNVIIASLWERMTIDDIIQMEQQNQ